MTDNLPGYLILLYSRLSDLITTLELSLSSSPLGHEVSVSDPHMVPLATNDVAPVMYPKSRTATESRPIVSCIAVQPAEYKMRHDLTSPNYQTQGMQFYKLFTLRSDLSVCECLYVHRPEGKVNRISAPPYKIKSNAPRSAPVATEDSFVVEDQEIDITEVRNGMTLERFLRRGASEYLVNHEHTDWTVDSEVLYRISTDITASTISNESSSATENLDLRSSMESIRERLNAKAEGGKWSIESL